VLSLIIVVLPVLGTDRHVPSKWGTLHLGPTSGIAWWLPLVRGKRLKSLEIRPLCLRSGWLHLWFTKRGASPRDRWKNQSLR
jgi:hypothetical protein